MQKRHNVRDLSELHPGQAVLFLNPADTNIYIEGTITGPSTTPHSYTIEAQGRTYHHNREHIQPINIDNPAISRPSAHQENPISGPSPQQSPISSPSSNSSCQNTSAKPSKPSHIPTPRSSASSSCSPATKQQVNNHYKPISRIPTSKNKFISRPPAYLSTPASQKSVVLVSQDHPTVHTVIPPLQDHLIPQQTIIQLFQDHHTL